MNKLMRSTETLLNTLVRNPKAIKTKNQAKQLHAQILKSTNALSPRLSTTLYIYSNLNLLNESVLLFNSLNSRTVLAWRSIIRCYANNGLIEKSLNSLIEMCASGKQPDQKLLPSVLKSCTLLLDLRLGEAIHGCTVRLGLDLDLMIGNGLMNMYAKCQGLEKSPEGMQYFDFSSGSVGCDKLSGRTVSHEFGRMGYSDDELGRPIMFHDRTLDSNMNDSVYEYKPLDIHHRFKLNNINDTLPQTGSTDNGSVDCCFVRGNDSVQKIDKTSPGIFNARKIFEMMPIRDVVSWNTMITVNAKGGMHKEALRLVKEMGEASMKPDSFTLSSVLPIFSEFVDVMKGKEIHGYAIRHGFDTDVFIGSGLIDMYAKCTRVDDSHRVFSLLPQRDSISWNSIIAGCVKNGLFDVGLNLFRQMLVANIRPKHVSFSAIMPACAHLTTLHLGKQLHAYIVRGGFDDNMFIASALVDMYGKCGNIRIARWIFDTMEHHDIVAWTAIIMGHALHGHASDALSLFKKMEMEGVKPNYVAFVAVLTACSHAGWIEEAWGYFNSMTKNYRIAPGLEHYAALADLLGRAGKLEEAYDFISRMGIAPTGGVWANLLAACRVYKNVELAEKVANNIFEIDPENIGAYILLHNVYSATGRQNDAAKLQSFLTNNSMTKSPDRSWIEVKTKMHAFVAGDKSHPYYGRLNEFLKVLLEQMRREGYVPVINLALHNVDEAQKEYLPSSHSEKLTMPFGVVSTPSGTMIRVTNNIRVSVDSLTAINFISKIVKREIGAKDNSICH